jgi:hypothetical protein
LVTATGAGFAVAAKADTYTCAPILEFFEAMRVPPTSGTRSIQWETLEGEFKLEGTLDSLGHIYITYELRSPDIGSNRWWSFTGRLVLELGSVAMYCDRAEAFWNGAT